jgi:hypothetical protein
MHSVTYLSVFFSFSDAMAQNCPPKSSLQGQTSVRATQSPVVYVRFLSFSGTMAQNWPPKSSLLGRTSVRATQSPVVYVRFLSFSGTMAQIWPPKRSLLGRTSVRATQKPVGTSSEHPSLYYLQLQGASLRNMYKQTRVCNISGQLKIFARSAEPSCPRNPG